MAVTTYAPTSATTDRTTEPQVAVRSALSRIFYLPMEIASRELDSRLLIGALALERGYEVVLGQKWLIERNIRAMQPGIYLAKTLTQRDAKFMSRARALGYFVAAIDEEMPGLVTSAADLRWVSEAAIKATNLLFAPGTANVHALQVKYPWAADRIRAVGNPRVDLLRPELRHFYQDEVERIRSRYGPFILINTNLGFTNSEKGPVDVIVSEQARLGKLDLGKASDVAYVDGIKAMEAANRQAIIELLKTLPDAIPSHRIVLRPHPSEDLKLWRSIIGPSNRIDLIREGPVAPWILASDVLVHTNCTTGVEAVALDRPSICLLPTETDVNRRYLSNRVNPVARSVAEAVQMVRQAVAAPGRFQYSPEMLAQFKDAMSFDDDRLAASSLIDAIEQALGPIPGGGMQWRPSWKYRWRQADKNVRGKLMPTLDLDQVTEHLRRLRGLLRLGCDVAVEPCGTKLVHLSRDGLPTSVRLHRTLARILAFHSSAKRSLSRDRS